MDGESIDNWADADYLARRLAVTEQVTNALAAGTPLSWRLTTYRTVLSAVLNHAVRNETAAAELNDPEKLSRLVGDAADAAGAASAEHRDDAYEIILGGLLENEGEASQGPTETGPAGPPQPPLPPGPMVSGVFRAEPSEVGAGWPDAGDLPRTLAVAEQVTNVLTSAAPLSWRRTTYRAVLAAIVRDTVENGTPALEPDDAENLSQLVRDAVSAAAGARMEHRDDAYEIILGALLADWVDNWASSDDEGMTTEGTYRPR